MPAIVPFLPYIAAGASFLGGMVKNKSTQTSTTTPTFDPSFSPLKNTILQMTMNRLNTDPNLSGYQASGITNINRLFNNLKTSSDNNLATRGLSTSPVAANVDETREAARGSNIADFENQIPLLARQLKGEDLAAASGVLNMGRGQTTTGEVTGGGGLAGGITNLAQTLGYLSGKGAFAGTPSASTFTPSTPGQPLLPMGWSPYRPAGQPALNYQPQGFTGWMG